jgi:DNA polymerase-3 subunit gamma/tau
MATSDTAPSPYLVLARKYRPSSFASLIGQDAMVQTLGNAFKSNRIHHAFILTGVRGVGKTTTARILARAFNYEDATGKHPTLDLEVEGEHCRAIIEGRHVDVVEMDAASNTSINDIREIIDSVKYGPVSAPYKVYIIDEVHMLSTAAFNGLLKTLEEPPPYVKFIFATTEIRKVPVTILSRCMRFDLRRITPEIMTPYLEGILQQEGIGFEPEALAMIVRAGEGSARDCLSLLDQGIAHGAGTVTAESVKAMLGLADRAKTIDLFENLMGGQIAEALGDIKALYDAGADPQTIVADLADFTHLVTRIKVVPAAADDVSLTPDERKRGAELASKLGMRQLTRTWQILFKGYDEVARAGNAMQAAEMVLIRLAYAADLPTPDELIAKLANQPMQQGSAPSLSAPRPNGGGGGASAQLRVESSQPNFAPQPVPQDVPQALLGPKNYVQLVALAGEKRDILLKHALEADVKPVSFDEGRIEIALREGVDRGVVQQLAARLKQWTGRPWMVILSNTAPTAPTIREVKIEREQTHRREAHDDPLVQAILETFPGAKVVNVQVREDAALDGTADMMIDAAPDSEEDDDA